MKALKFLNILPEILDADYTALLVDYRGGVGGGAHLAGARRVVRRVGLCSVKSIGFRECKNNA